MSSTIRPMLKQGDRQRTPRSPWGRPPRSPPPPPPKEPAKNSDCERIVGMVELLVENSLRSPSWLKLPLLLGLLLLFLLALPAMLLLSPLL